MARIQFVANAIKFEWDMYVAPITEDGLIGMDFLFAHDLQLGARYGFELNGQRIHTQTQCVCIPAVRITLLEDTVVPANSQAVIGGMAELAAQALGTKVELVEPMPNRELLAIVHRDCS